MYLESPELSDNPEPRCPVVLLLDTSGSMEGTRIQELNKGLQVLKQELEKDPTVRLRVEVAIVTFGGSVALAHDFATMDSFQPPTLSAIGLTPMGAAIDYALQLVAERKEQYKNHGLKYYQPWVWLITDGAPTDDWKSAAQKVHQAQKDKKITFFAVAVQGADMNKLQEIAPPESPPRWLDGLDFKAMFTWLSKSVGATASRPINEQGQVAREDIDWGHF